MDRQEEQQKKLRKSYAGRWVLDEGSQRMVFIMEPRNPTTTTRVTPLPDQSSSSRKVTVELSDLECQENKNAIRGDGKLRSHGNPAEDRNSIKKNTMFLKPEKGEGGKRAQTRKSNQMKGGKANSARYSIAMYVLFGLSFLAIAVGGGISAMVYFGVITIGGGNVESNNASNVTSSSEIEASSMDTVSSSQPDLQKPAAGPEAADPTNSIERKIINDILSGHFRVSLDETNKQDPVNRAVSWMAEELRHVSSQLEEASLYSDLVKFIQRFALLTLQYSLDRGNTDQDYPNNRVHRPQFFFERQQGVDDCDWFGVTCDSYGRVTRVDFSDNELTGSIPSEIRFLYEIETLNLSNNSIVGTIPEELYSLRSLQRIYLYQNKLTGTISSSIGQLNSLQYLHLSHNSLTGSIPSEIRSWSNNAFRPLKYLNLYDNRLTGTIPNNLGLRDLFYFDIGRNYIGGSIPEDLGTDFSELRYLHVDHNRLTQRIPYTIPPMADGRLVSFLADHNQLTGVVPDNWIMFNKLVQYTLHANNFDYLGPENCNFNVFAGGQLVEFKADCDICSCGDMFCDAMCSPFF